MRGWAKYVVVLNHCTTKTLRLVISYTDKIIVSLRHTSLLHSVTAMLPSSLQPSITATTSDCNRTATLPLSHTVHHSAMLPQCHSSTLPHCHAAPLPLFHTVTLSHCHSPTLPHCLAATLSCCQVPLCHSAMHTATLPRTLPHCHTATLPCGSTAV